QFARDKELESDWAVVPQTVVVPPDSLIYAVDQAQLDKQRLPAPNQNEAVVQIQRWVYEYRPDPKKDDTHPVGEWVVASRLLVRTGEYLRDVANTRASPLKTPLPIKPSTSRDADLDEKRPLKCGDESPRV